MIKLLGSTIKAVGVFLSSFTLGGIVCARLIDSRPESDDDAVFAATVATATGIAGTISWYRWRRWLQRRPNRRWFKPAAVSI